MELSISMQKYVNKEYPITDVQWIRLADKPVLSLEVRNNSNSKDWYINKKSVFGVTCTFDNHTKHDIATCRG